MAQARKHTFYIATRLERAAAHNLVRDGLGAAGWAITYDWTVHGSVQQEGAARLREVAASELAGVAEADVVVVLLPGGRGTHAELGIALATGAEVFVCAEDESFFFHDERTCAFYWAAGVRRIVGPCDRVAEKVRLAMREEDALDAILVMRMRAAT